MAKSRPGGGRARTGGAVPGTARPTAVFGGGPHTRWGFPGPPGARRASGPSRVAAQWWAGASAATTVKVTVASSETFPAVSVAR